MTASAPIAFIDLQAQRASLGAALEDSILRVVRSGRYILGPEIAELESKLAAFCGAPYALSCANGTDALALLLMLKDLKPGQAVLVPSFTYAATGEVVVWFGATPIFVDCDPVMFCVDPASAEAGVANQHHLVGQRDRKQSHVVGLADRMNRLDRAGALDVPGDNRHPRGDGIEPSSAQARNIGRFYSKNKTLNMLLRARWQNADTAPTSLRPPLMAIA